MEVWTGGVEVEGLHWNSSMSRHIKSVCHGITLPHLVLLFKKKKNLFASFFAVIKQTKTKTYEYQLVLENYKHPCVCHYFWSMFFFPLLFFLIEHFSAPELSSAQDGTKRQSPGCRTKNVSFKRKWKRKKTWCAHMWHSGNTKSNPPHIYFL